MTMPTGRIVGEFSQKSATPARRRFFIWLTVALLGVLVIVYFLATPIGWHVFFLTSGVIALSLLAAIYDLRLALGGRKLTVYSDGLTLSYQNEKVYAAYRWDEIKKCDLIAGNIFEVSYGGPLGRIAYRLAADVLSQTTATMRQAQRLTLNLQGCDSRRYKLDKRFVNYVPMLEAMSQAMKDALLTQAIDHVKRGNALIFDIVVVRLDGLYKGNEHVSWADVLSAEMKGLAVEITVRQGDKPRRFARVSPALDRPILAAVIKTFAPGVQSA